MPDATIGLPAAAFAAGNCAMMMSGRKSDLAELSQSILRYANRGAARIEFLTWVSEALVTYLGCHSIEVWVRDPRLFYRWEFAIGPERAMRFTVLRNRRGSLEAIVLKVAAPGAELYPFQVGERTLGLLAVRSAGRQRTRSCEAIAQSLGLAIATRRAQWALRERVKELTCLYELGRIVQEVPAVDDGLQRIVELLPPAWQFPEIARARIVLDGRSFTTEGFQESQYRQAAPLEVKGAARGSVEVVYLDEEPEFAEGPFLAEERHLIDTVAREVAAVIARREAEEYESRLQAQLRHADRLATIGQLAAGVAHELNEPLGSILGFAQLMQKEEGMPESAARDLGRIIAASLHAREVIHKLLVFSRQKKPVKAVLDLNRVVREGLYFLESRCARAGIAVEPQLDPELPEIEADAFQLHQVLVNLVVNSIQAMPNGGEIRIRTRAHERWVSLAVEDNGTGMSEEVKEKIFTPFFTTKDVNEGTGLGLAVVHGIVTSHGGSIAVESAPGKGTRMDVRLPRNGPGKDKAR